VAAAESGGDEVDEVFIVQELVDRPELGGPELVTIGQQYLEDAALRIHATDHGAPIETGRLRYADDANVDANITDDDEAQRAQASRKLSVLSMARRRSPRKTRPSAVTSAPGSS